MLIILSKRLVKSKKIKSKFSIATSVVIIFLFLASEIQLSLPKDESGELYMEGTLINCQIGDFGRNTGVVKVSIVSNDDEVRKFEHVTRSRKLIRYFYPDFCNKKPKVNVWFHAERTLLNPKTTYMIDKIVEES